MENANSNLKADRIDIRLRDPATLLPYRMLAHPIVSAGRKVVVIDQRDNALGSTSVSTALLQYEIDTNLIDLTELLGWARASQAYLACVESLSLLESLAGDLARSVNFERCKSLYLASTDADVAKLKEEVAARQRAGLDVEWLDAKQLRSRFDCHRPGAILSAAGAQVDPYRFTYGLLERIVERGASVYARTAVSKIKQVRDRIRLCTRHCRAKMACPTSVMRRTRTRAVLFANR